MKNFIPIRSGNLEVRLALKQDLEELYRLRYQELLLSYNENAAIESGMFTDIYDRNCDNLIVVDLHTNRIVGSYRLITEEHIGNGTFYTEEEFDISNLKHKNILEVGRAFVKSEYRNGSVIMLLWRGILRYAVDHDARYIFGMVSFHGTSPQQYDHALSYIYYHHISPEDTRTHAIGNHFSINLLSESEVDDKTARAQMPPLVKGYLMAGSTFSGNGFIDKSFNSIDLLAVLDIRKVNPQYLHKFLM